MRETLIRPPATHGARVCVSGRTRQRTHGPWNADDVAGRRKPPGPRHEGEEEGEERADRDRCSLGGQPRKSTCTRLVQRILDER